MRDGKIEDEGSFSTLRQYSPVCQEMWAHRKEVVEQPEEIV
ncbi:hypothetical protein [Spirosoma endophyticum]|uniref:Uncharacterized protein n=1 Tax=Spirosoma endophyticum TaxID=662367 RepID=A0A1I1WWE9_9BACT|nr:hypothetical protein [Spirosoma endophyticum]SFD97400.1 hypothetical protein SAMN05216167_10928 [Spirosoma endophyticum]